MIIKRSSQLLMIVTLLFNFGCLEKKTTSKNIITTSTNNPSTGGGNNSGGGSNTSGGSNVSPPVGECHGTGSEPGISDAGQTIDYYKISEPPIVAHGHNEGVIAWSSESNMPAGISQDIFFTNARFNVRVIPRRRYFGTDSKGVACAYQPRPYGRMQVGVRVRKRESPGSGDYHLFDNVRVDCASKVHSFQVPANTAFPLVVEILNVKWDWSCKSYEQQGFPNVDGVCPWDNVWLTECYSMELQVSTDTTKDLPGPKTTP